MALVNPWERLPACRHRGIAGSSLCHERFDQAVYLLQAENKSTGFR